MLWWRRKREEAEKERNEKKTHETETRQWSELPMDLLREVAGKLYFSDHIRFYAVCKDWLATKYCKTPEPYSLPWRVRIRCSANKVLKCHLYEPFSRNQKPTMTLEIPLHQFLSKDHTCSSDKIDIRYGYGWLLLSISHKHFCGYTNWGLFCMMSKKTITLPTLHHPQGRKYALVNSFSSEPESPDCVFLVVQVTCSDENTISTLRRGDKDWTTKTMYRKYHSFLSRDAVYIKGIFYFVTYGGQVASYDITHGVWRDERESDDSIVNHNSMFRKQEVFQLKGDLVRICIGKPYSHRKNQFCFIRKFDMSIKVWVPLQSLGCDRALFVSRNSFCVSTIGVAAKKNGVLANHIYGITTEGRTWHSLDDGKLINIISATLGITDKWVVEEDYGTLSFWFEPLIIF